MEMNSFLNNPKSKKIITKNLKTSINESEIKEKGDDSVQYISIFSALSSISSLSTPKNQILITDSGEVKQEIVRGIPLPGVTFDEANIQVKFKENEKYSSLYINQGKFSLGKDFIVKFSESQIRNSIQSFFDSCICKASVLFLSGHGQPGEFHIETAEGEKALKYKEIAEMWARRKSFNTNKYLLIIIDSCYSGSWVYENIENLHFADHIGIFVQASCQRDEKSSDIKEKGGLLIWNFIELNTKTRNNEMEILKNLKGISQQPCSAGFYFKIEKLFKLRLMCESWSDFYIPEFQEKYEEDAYYEGELNSNNMKHGKGLLSYDNGCCYEGEFKNDEFEGKGIFYFDNGNVYEGEWKKGKRSGKGVLYFYSDKTRYVGEFLNDCFHGNGKICDINRIVKKQGLFKNNELIEGTIFYDNNKKEIYHGQINLNMKHGKGVYYHSNGDKYIGFFKDDKRDGFGVFYDKNGNVTKSNSWENDFLNGFAIKYYNDGDIYKGFFKNNIYEGYGIYSFNGNEEDIYEGEYSEDQMHGIGIRYNAENQENFKGLFKNDEKIFGKFEFGFKNNDTDLKEFNEFYEGEIYKDSFHGWGILKTENNDLYEGQFNNGNYEQFGILKFSNGRVYEGNFINNEFNGKGIFKWKEAINENKDDVSTDINNSDFNIRDIDEKSKEEDINRISKKKEEEFFFYEDEYSENNYYFDMKKINVSSFKIKNKFDKSINNNKPLSFQSDFDSDNSNNSNHEIYNRNLKSISMIELNNNQYKINQNKDFYIYKKNSNYSFKNSKNSINNAMECYYSGDWIANQKHGKGTLLDSIGLYTGDFIEDKKTGKGRLIYHDSQTYQGEFFLNKRHGKGEMHLLNSEKYIGHFFEDKFEGEGIYYFTSSIFYKGMFRNNKRHGTGVFMINEFFNKIIYKGEWKDDLKNGKIYINLNDKKKFEAIFSNDEIYSGKGKIEIIGEYIYEGEVNKNFEKNGKGKITYLNNDEFDGEFVDDKKNGIGKHFFHNTGEIYEGNWENDLMNGLGKMTYANNCEYFGYWLNGKRNGQGTFKWPDGRNVSGVWVDNQIKKIFE